MLRTLQDLFGQLTGTAPQAEPHAHALHLCAAVLLVEVMRADGGNDQAEQRATLAALRTRYALDDAELDALVRDAQARAATSNDFFAFTDQLNTHLPQPDKIALVESMWQVAYADGVLDANENHVISKIAGLLHVTHGEYIAAKMHAKQAAGLG